MSISAFRPTNNEFEQLHREYAQKVVGHAIPILDRNADAVLGRDEFKGTQFDRVDRNADGGISMAELEASLITDSSLDAVVAMWNNAATAQWKLGGNFDEFRFMGKASIGFGALVGGIGAWITGVTPWLALPLLPAIAFVAAGVYIHQTQGAKPDRLRERFTQQLDQALQGQTPALDNYDFLNTPFGNKVEEVIAAIGAVIYAPFRAIGELIAMLMFFFGPWPRR